MKYKQLHYFALDILSKSCQTLGKSSLQNCSFEKSGDIVTDYIVGLAPDSNLIQETNEKNGIIQYKVCFRYCKHIARGGGVIYLHFNVEIFDLNFLTFY